MNLKRALAFSASFAFLSLNLVGQATAQMPGHLEGQVVDENENGVEDVTITVTNPEAANFKQVEKSGKNGKYVLFLRNTLPKYKISFSKDGYQPFSVGPVKIAAKQRTRKTFVIKTNAAAVAAGAEMASAGGGGDIDADAIGKGGAMATYNKGVKAFNEGANDIAVVAFTEALEKDPELFQAYSALARAHRKSGNHQGAIDAATKAVEAEIDTGDMNQVLFDAYSALGDTENANNALAKLSQADPEGASKNFFNQAADLFNAGDMDGAKTALTQLLQVTPDHAKANYMMGMVLSGSDPAKAKEHIQKFLDLAPDDPDAETAKEMLKYL